MTINLLGLALLAAAVALAAVSGYAAGGTRRRGRHAAGAPVFDADPGGWDESGPAATLAAIPPMPWDGAEHHAEPPPAPGEGHYTTLDAWRLEESMERLATTSVTRLVSAIVRGMEYRDQIDTEAELILERMRAQLAIADIQTELQP